jgi:hypothetical protein
MQKLYAGAALSVITACVGLVPGHPQVAVLWHSLPARELEAAVLHTGIVAAAKLSTL